MTCKYLDCTRIHKAKGFCSAHYQRLQKFGDPAASKSVKRGGDPRHPAYHVYFNMLARCGNSNQPNYAYYGGRGIRVCERWSSPGGFARFVEDMGHRPANHSIERSNVNGNYEPKNCHWASQHEQMSNTRAVGPTPGVTLHRHTGKWRARVKIGRVEHYLGIFSDKAEAVKARADYCRLEGLE